MNKTHLDWLTANLNKIEEVFAIDKNIVPTDKRNAEVYSEFVEIYSSKEEFDNYYKDLPPINDGESAFDYLKSINTADIVNGMYIFFDYMIFDELFPGREVAV